MRGYEGICLATLLASCLESKAEDAGRFTVDFSDRSHVGCSFLASPVNFCEQFFIDAYESAVKSAANFNGNMVLFSIDTRPEYAQQALVAVDRSTNIVYPLPFDHFSRTFGGSSAHAPGQIQHSLDSHKVCIRGQIMAYRSVQGGELCWTLVEGKFIGTVTPYTYPDH